MHNTNVCAVRANAQECAELGRIFAEKVNRATGRTAVLLPLKGKDKYEQPPDGPWIDPEADKAMYGQIRQGLRADIPLREIDANINDPAFADATADAFLDLWHAAQVLRPAGPKPMKKLARRAHSLSNIAGEDHDLAVLLDEARGRAHTLQPRELELLDALIARRRASLQQNALARGRRVYGRKPRKLARRITAATLSHG